MPRFNAEEITASLGQNIFRNLIIYCAYLVTAWIGLSVPFEGDKVTLFWLPSGIAVAAIYRYGINALPSIYFAALTINLLTGASLLTNLVIALGNTTAAWVAANLLHKWNYDPHSLSPQTALKIIAIAIFSMTISSGIGSLTLSLQHQLVVEKSFFIMLAWWMGDSLGVLLCAPLLISLSQDSPTQTPKGPQRLLFGLILVLLTGAFCFPLNNFSGQALPIVFITFVATAWISLSLGIIGGSLSALFFGFVAIWSSINQLGPFVFDNPQLSYWVIWVYTVALTLLNMMITSAHREILTTNTKLHDANTNQEIQQAKIRDLDSTLAAVAADSADNPNFFIGLLNALGQALKVEHLSISIVNHSCTQATTHTFLTNSELQENFSYTLADTPCNDVMKQNFCFIEQDAAKLYPKDRMLADAKIQSYIGIIIKNVSGSSIGILNGFGTQPLKPPPQINLLMQIFSERIAGELRRADDQEKIFHLAFYDSLTGLPNRRLLQDRLQLIVDQSQRSNKFSAILFIDLDHFKLLNDSRGHQIGDHLLQLVAERIRNAIRSTDLAARLGGDEFVVIFDNLGVDAEQASLEAQKRTEELHQLISLPYPLLGSVHHCTISIGVNLFKGKDIIIGDLLRHADLAMYHAKDSGRNSIRFFDPLMQAKMEIRTNIEQDLRVALAEENQLIPYFQIQIDDRGSAIGAELLLRWKHPSKGFIPPCDFIPVAEQTGLIVPLGRRVLTMACHQLALWKNKPGFEQLNLSINVSPIEFNQKTFNEDTLTTIQQFPINTRQLVLELTEGSLLQNIENSIEKMQALKEQAIEFAMDDFGIGYSSLSHLKKLPLNLLKIDQSFVRDISIDPNDKVIVRTIIAMARSLELDVLAEGVETQEQKEFLLENGCHKFQGYYFGKPVPIEEFEMQLTAKLNC